MSSVTDLCALERAALNEQLSPVLLPWKAELTENIKEQILLQDTELQNVGMTFADPKLAGSVFQLDLDRAKYLLSSYLRRRLLKIQSHYRFIGQHQQNLLSRPEIEFLTDYSKVKENHYKEAFLLKLPPTFRKLGKEKEDGPDPITVPDEKKYVCVRVLQDAISLDIDGETVELKKDAVWMLPYSRVTEFVTDGRVELI